MVIEVHVGSGEHLAAGMVLQLDQLLGEIGPMVVVNNGQRSSHDLVLVRLARDQVVANEIAYGLGPVLVAPLANGFIELVEQLLLQRNTGPNNVGHWAPPNLRKTHHTKTEPSISRK